MQASTEDLSEQGENRQFVTFLVDKEVFAVPMAPVREIIRAPEVMAVPLSPPSLKGLSNLRGQVLPIISLRHIFNFSVREDDDSTRVLVIDHGIPVGFVVDRVASVISVEPQHIEDVTSIQSTVNSDFLEGVINNAGGHEMIMILDFSALIEREFAELSANMRDASSLALMQGGSAQHQDMLGRANNDELQLVSFVVAEQEYAIAIERVQEIVQVPEHIMQVPNSRSHVLGIMTLRNRLLPLVSLRLMFNLPMEALSEHNRIVVISLDEGVSVGIVMDTVNEVLRVQRSIVDEMPGLLARNQDIQEIESICRIDGGKRLVSILSAERMFNHKSIHEAIKTVESMKDTEDTAHEGTLDDESSYVMDDDEQMVVFRLAHEEFGVPIASVQEIVRVPEVLTRVPKAPVFVEGVINLRGTVLPVVDQRRRFGLPDMTRNDRQRIMVFLINGTRTGFIVDSVSEVLKVPKAVIGPAPRLSSEQAEIIQRVANLEKQHRMILLLDVDQMMDAHEIEVLSKVAVGQGFNGNGSNGNGNGAAQKPAEKPASAPPAIPVKQAEAAPVAKPAAPAPAEPAEAVAQSAEDAL